MISDVSLLEKCTVANDIRLVHLKAISSYDWLYIDNQGISGYSSIAHEPGYIKLSQVIDIPGYINF